MKVCPLLVFAAIALTGCEPEAPRSKLVRNPEVSGNGTNVLMIAIDDLNTFASHLGRYADVQTPGIDRVAAAGTSFSSAYAAAPACNPSRTSVFSGQRPDQTGIYQNPEDETGALRKFELIPQYLASNGYLTMATGKLLHRIEDNPEFFERVYTATGSYTSETRLNGIDALDENFDWGPLAVADDDTPDFDRVNWAIEQLRSEHEAPFFLGVGLVRPHLPWTVPEEYFDRFPLDEIELPPGILANDRDDLPRGGLKEGIGGDHEIIVEAEKWKEAVQAYLASVAYADAAVARLWEALQASEYKDNTLVILWGDHGWQFGEKERWRKFTLWSAGSQTTFVVVAPESAARGQVCDRPVDLMTIYPTVLDMTGLAARGDIEGVSLRPLLESCAADWKATALTTNGPNNHAIRRDNWSYLRHANGDEELYDRESDPWEWHNLAEDAETTSLREEFRRLLPCKTWPVIGTTWGCDRDD